METFPQTHVMIDLETLGTGQDAAIISLGAVTFNPHTGAIGPDLYCRIDWDSALSHGSFTVSTLKWWMSQSETARTEVLKEGKSLSSVLKRLVITMFSDDYVIVWGNGATFDITLLEHAFNSCGLDVPWKFYNVRDVRTVVHMADEIGVSRPCIDSDKAHNALEDAIHQAKNVSTMWQALTKEM